jgi:transcriptional regulator of arginine metabolism
MSRDPKIRAERHKAIQKLFEDGFEIKEQKELVQHLYRLGFDVTQSSVSRDLRDLGAYWRDGIYHLPEVSAQASASFAQITDYITGGRTIGDHLILLEVQRGTAGLVANILDECGWADIGGVMASLDDKVLILTEDGKRQRKVLSHLPHRDDD